MSIAQINPYLNFDGTAQQAIELYQRALGAQLELVQRFGDGPGPDSHMPDEIKQRVMHARIKIGDAVILISDGRPGDPPRVGDNVQLCIQSSDGEAMKRQFAALAEGGKVVMALEKTFWAPLFGMLVDAHGISWMFNLAQEA
ncbi:MAG TPA: VOC family protein [Kofleriaceae bacterium]|nr:VOC family protein [Kofleriaceae bacterium]